MCNKPDSNRLQVRQFTVTTILLRKLMWARYVNFEEAHGRNLLKILLQEDAASFIISAICCNKKSGRNTGASVNLCRPSFKSQCWR